MRTALVCIAKNEDNYIEEWINYHLKLGFTDIFIYENNWRCNIENSKVTKIPFDGEVMQKPAYNHFIENYNKQFDWVGFIDVDEFLTLKIDKNVSDFFKRFDDYNGVGVNWVLFGDNGLEKVDTTFSVLERFTKRQNQVNVHIKSFMNLKKIKNFVMGVHNPNIPISNQNFETFSSPFCKNCETPFAQLNHYFCKTKEEFIEKVNRGRADTRMIRSYNEFDGHNFNEVEDFSALNFYKNDYNNLFNT